MRVVLLNPNRSLWITDLMAQVAREVLHPREELDAITSQDGPEVVKTPEQTGLAAFEIQAMAQRYGANYDAVIVGISLDCGLHSASVALQPKPVIGMTQAACLMAGRDGRRFGILTVGSVMQPLYEQHVQALGLHSSCVGVLAPDCPSAFAGPGTNTGQEVVDALSLAVEDLHSLGAESVVLAGAVLCGLGKQLSQRTGIQVWEGPQCAVEMARSRLQQGGKVSQP